MDIIKEHCDMLYKFMEPDKYTELRLINGDGAKSYYVDNIRALSIICDRLKNDLTDKHRGLYIGINSRNKNGTKDADISKIKCIFFDIDPIRSKHVPATPDQIADAFNATMFVTDYLKYKQPLIMSTGNGYHVIYRISDLDNTEQNRNKISVWGRTLIRTINNNEDFKKFNCVLDYSFNVSRMTKVPGIKVPSADNRLAYILNYTYLDNDNDIINDNITDDIVNTEIMECIAAQVPGAGDMVNDYDRKQIKILIDKDRKMYNLFNGHINGYPSRSEAELALICKCVYYGMNNALINSMMNLSKIGKWLGSSDSYKQYTISKALGLVMM